MKPKPNTGQLVVGGAEFLARIADEIARTDRYEHPFTIVTLRPPAGVAGAEVMSAGWLESSASGLTRGCDVVTVLDDGPTLMILLPETGVSGGASVLERLRDAVDDADQTWEYRLFEYPRNRAQVEDLMQRAA